MLLFVSVSAVLHARLEVEGAYLLVWDSKLDAQMPGSRSHYHTSTDAEKLRERILKIPQPLGNLFVLDLKALFDFLRPFLGTREM